MRQPNYGNRQILNTFARISFLSASIIIFSFRSSFEMHLMVIRVQCFLWNYKINEIVSLCVKIISIEILHNFLLYSFGSPHFMSKKSTMFGYMDRILTKRDDND